jgi:hypothetical protein
MIKSLISIAKPNEVRALRTAWVTRGFSSAWHRMRWASGVVQTVVLSNQIIRHMCEIAATQIIAIVVSVHSESMFGALIPGHRDVITT